MTTTHICVGGPLAGQKKTVLYGRRFHVNVQPKRETSYLFLPGFEEADTVTYTTVEYIEQYFCHVSGRVIFWAPSDQTPTESMRLLLKAYEAYYAKAPPPPTTP